MVIIKFAVLEKTEPGLRFYAFAYEETGYSLRKLPVWRLSDSQAGHFENNIILKTLKVYKLKMNVLICRNTGFIDVFCQYNFLGPVFWNCFQVLWF